MARYKTMDGYTKPNKINEEVRSGTVEKNSPVQKVWWWVVTLFYNP